MLRIREWISKWIQCKYGFAVKDGFMFLLFYFYFIFVLYVTLSLPQPPRLYFPFKSFWVCWDFNMLFNKINYSRKKNKKTLATSACILPVVCLDKVGPKGIYSFSMIISNGKSYLFPKLWGKNPFLSGHFQCTSVGNNILKPWYFSLKVGNIICKHALVFWNSFIWCLFESVKYCEMVPGFCFLWVLYVRAVVYRWENIRSPGGKSFPPPLGTGEEKLGLSVHFRGSTKNQSWLKHTT